MGFYVNPDNESKESFLHREGLAAPSNSKISWEHVSKGFLPVVLVDNGHFTAAAIAYCAKELDEFTSMSDRRPRKIFLVKVEKLIAVADADFASYARKNGLI